MRDSRCDFLGMMPSVDKRTTKIVRILLPNDTVIRVDVQYETTVDKVARAVESAGGSGDGSLRVVRAGYVFRAKERLWGRIKDQDILEWFRTTAKHKEFGKRTNQGDGNERKTVVLRRKRPTGRHQSAKVVVTTSRRPIRPHQASHPSFGSPEADAFPDACRDFMIRTNFQFMDQWKQVQTESRELFMILRDQYTRHGAQYIQDLFPCVERLIYMTSEQAQLPDTTETRSIRWAYPLICRSLWAREMTVVMRGYVECAEWRALWRNQRREYLCLCDGATLYFFASKMQCEEYLFELTRDVDDEDSKESETHKKILKENAPQQCIELGRNKWSIRKGEKSIDPDDAPDMRHAFALFDAQGKLKLILDVASENEANQWIGAIKSELNRSQLYAKIDQREHSISDNGTDGLKPSIAFANGSSIQDVEIPLRWLHRYIDERSSGSATRGRRTSSTMTQAKKDVRRDRLCLNGTLLTAMSLEDIVQALLIQIMSAAKNAIAEIEAFQFAHLLLISSSRTQGGGDILDAIQLIFPGSHFCVCPDANVMEPILLDLSYDTNQTGDRKLVAEIRICMGYRILHAGQDDEGVVEMVKTDGQAIAQVQGQYYRRLVCDQDEWNRLEGVIRLQVIAQGGVE